MASIAQLGYVTEKCKIKRDTTLQPLGWQMLASDDSKRGSLESSVPELRDAAYTP